jgi:hypothetical protein
MCRISRFSLERLVSASSTPALIGLSLGGALGLWAGPLALAAQFEDALGEAGIQARTLQAAPYNLTGRKIAIGQVEPGRPGQFGYDKKIDPQLKGVFLAGLFFRNHVAKSNTDVDGHAHNVASVMVSRAKAMRGVAPEARLYASAVGNIRRNGQPEECLAASYIAQQNGGDVRAINMSFGESLRQDARPDALLDGNALLTQCIDWSSRVHNVLYAIAGNQGKGGIPIPTDNYNGITVAYTQARNGIFDKLDFANLGNELASVAYRFEGKERNKGGRASIGLVAPGNNIRVVNPNGSFESSSGTSFAAPQVTASVALLQEYGDRQIQLLKAQKITPAPWSLDSRRQEVMKAVLLNAADKVKDKGDGLLLGMTRTLYTQAGDSWLQSIAYRDRTRPLDPLLGAGQLNVFRAYQQFSAGQFSAGQFSAGQFSAGQFSAGQGSPTGTVPNRGWDYRSVASKTVASKTTGSGAEAVPVFRDYVLDKPLKMGSFVSATLTWQRHVDLVDTNKNGTFDLGESFRDRGLNHLNLYLMPAEATNTAQAIWSSESPIDSVEHIFHAIPSAGRYKLRVQYQEQVNEPSQPYGLAWWSSPQ